jgi:hypothetical protein
MQTAKKRSDWKNLEKLKLLEVKGKVSQGCCFSISVAYQDDISTFIGNKQRQRFFSA